MYYYTVSILLRDIALFSLGTQQPKKHVENYPEAEFKKESMESEARDIDRKKPIRIKMKNIQEKLIIFKCPVSLLTFNFRFNRKFKRSVIIT